jgi:hypothetical protein
MRQRPTKTQPPQFLSGWKEIANYLGKGVRTVQRYERQLGLPVRRPAGKPWGSVIATRAELDGWVEASPIREAFHLRDFGPHSSSPANEIKSAVMEMVRLREHMFALRAEVRESVRMLHQSVRVLQDGLKVPAWEGLSLKEASSALYSSDERASLLQSELEVLNLPAKYLKAS